MSLSADNAKLLDHADRLGGVEMMLTLADFAKVLQVDKRTAERWLASGLLPAPDLRVGQRVMRWRRCTVEKFIQQGGRL